ncbi:MAG: tetratricopeptide repeat protein [Planctomycetota bacterium]
MSALRRACALALVGLACALGARAQDDLETQVDADYRVYDLVYLKATGKAVECTIVEGDDPDRVTIQRRGRSGSVSVERSEVLKIVRRQTPQSAYQERAELVLAAQRADLHRRLAEWCLKQSLQSEAEAQLELAATTESDPAAANGHRERLAGLLEARAWQQAPPADPQLLERIVRLVEAGVQSGAPSARLQLAQARVALELGLQQTALEALAASAGELARRAQGEPPAVTGAAVELDPEAPRERFRDRAGVPFVPPPAPAEDAPAPPPPSDASELVGLSAAEQTLFRVVNTLRGEQLVDAGQPAEAQAAFEAVLRAWPADARAAAGLGRALAAQGQLPQAAQALETALAAHADDPDLLLVRGQLRYLEGDVQAAEKALEAAVGAAGPEGTLSFRAAHTALGLSRLLAGDLTEAEAAFVAADGDPGFAPARVGRGLVAEFQNDPDAARTHYEEAARLDPQDPEAHYSLAQLQLAAGQLEQAETSLRAALQAGYVLELGVTSMVEVARARKDAAAATRLLELLYRVEEAPDARLLSALGNAYLGHERVEDAEGLFRQALEQAPDHVPSLRGLAYCAYTQGQLSAARALFERLLADGRKDAWASAGLLALDRQAARRVWQDGFSGTTLQTLWKREADYGLKVSAADGHAVFQGSQQNDAQGITSLMRRVDGEQVVQVVAVLDLPPGGYRAGVRFESERGGAVLFRDFDGLLRYATSNGRQGWNDPVELGSWPGSGPHRLAIDLAEPAKGGVRFVLDGEVLGEAEVQALRANKGSTQPVRVGVYGRGQALGQRVDFRCDGVEVYVQRAVSSGATPPKRY